jgi:hypothetical protein
MVPGSGFKVQRSVLGSRFWVLTFEVLLFEVQGSLGRAALNLEPLNAEP